jgi:hypothetical protein
MSGGLSLGAWHPDLRQFRRGRADHAGAVLGIQLISDGASLLGLALAVRRLEKL